MGQIEVMQVSPKDWEQLSEKAHLIAFNTHKPKEWDRIHFALVIERQGEMLAYITCRENDAHTLYWQFGGAFPGTRETSLSFSAYREAIKWCEGKYKIITTMVENTNVVMLKMALKAGFLIVGTKVWNGTVLVELHRELRN